jgi:hypothetical protein
MIFITPMPPTISDDGNGGDEECQNLAVLWMGAAGSAGK